MKIQKMAWQQLCYSRLALAACGNSEKKADNANNCQNQQVNRSGSEEKRWDKIQELVQKDGITLGIYRVHRLSQPNKATADGNIGVERFPAL